MAISLLSQRIVHNGFDASIRLNDYRTGSYAMTYSSGEYLYIGSFTPFNNMWIEFATASGVSSGAPLIDVRWANAWSSVVDITDETNGMQTSGRITWSLHIDRGWDRERRSQEDAGINGTSIYNMYWMRVSWPSSFSATLAYVGQKFCGDTVFRSSYPDLMQPALLTGYQSGKTSWDEQHFMSSECIIKDLKSRRYIVDKGQIFDWTALESAATHKSAAIIYSAFGASYADRAARAEGLYQDEMNARLIPLDKNADGKLSGEETVQKEQWMTR